MADRPQGIENMAVSSDSSASQHNLKDNEKEENDLRGTPSFPKVDAPKKKTTFKITSVTKSSQRGGSGDLTQDNDLDSQDDLDETVDSHTEDLSSEIYDTNSKATDVDIQDPLLTPEEVIKESEPKEKPARFKVVKVETKEPFKRGRWLCYDYLDAPEKSENKQEEINVNSGSSSAANSVHYVHGVDDPSKNPLLAGASGTLPSLQQPVPGDVSSSKQQGEALHQVQPASSSQPGLTPVSQTNSSFANHVAMSSVPAPYAAQSVVTGQTIGQSMRPVGSVTNIHQSQLGQTTTGQSVSGNAPYPGGQSQPIPATQGPSVPANVHSQPVSVPGSMSASQPMPPGAMQSGEYMNSMGQGQVSGVPGLPQQQQVLHDMSQQSFYAVNAGSIAALHPSQNHPSSRPSQLPDGFGSDVDISNLGGSNLRNLGVLRADGEDSTTALGMGLAPLEIAVGGITSAATDDEITEETWVAPQPGRKPPWGGERRYSLFYEKPHLAAAGRRYSLSAEVHKKVDHTGSGSSTVAIDNKIEQAMDLVKSHLMYAVREEVEVLKEQIKELMERLHKLEQENKVLRSEATPETLSKLPAPLPPIQNPLLQQLMTSLHNPPSSSTSS